MAYYATCMFFCVFHDFIQWPGTHLLGTIQYDETAQRPVAHSSTRDVKFLRLLRGKVAVSIIALIDLCRCCRPVERHVVC